VGRFFGPTPNIISGSGFFRGRAAPASRARFVAVGSNDLAPFATIPFITTRNDAGAWTVQNSSVFGARGLFSVAYVTGQWVAGTNNPGGSVIGTSVVATAWTLQANPSSGTNLVVCGGDAAHGNMGGDNAAVITSPDGVTWTPTGTIFGGSVSLNASAAGGGRYVLAAGTGSGNGLAFSTNGTSFTVESTLATTLAFAAIWDGSQFVVLCQVGGNTVLATSPDGATWTPTAALTFGAAAHIAFNGSVYVLAGGVQAAHAATVAALVTASPATFAANSITAITAGGGLFVAVDNSCAAYSSADGVTWVTEVTGVDPANLLNAIAFH
jgi:hypothetical protein